MLECLPSTENKHLALDSPVQISREKDRSEIKQERREKGKGRRGKRRSWAGHPDRISRELSTSKE